MNIEKEIIGMAESIPSIDRVEMVSASMFTNVKYVRIYYKPIIIGSRSYSDVTTMIRIADGAVTDITGSQSLTGKVESDLHPHVSRRYGSMCLSGGDIMNAIRLFNYGNIALGLMKVITTISSFYPYSAYRMPDGTMKCDVCNRWNENGEMLRTCVRCNETVFHTRCSDTCAACFSSDTCPSCMKDVETNTAPSRICKIHNEDCVVVCELCKLPSNTVVGICANCGRAVCGLHCMKYSGAVFCLPCSQSVSANTDVANLKYGDISRNSFRSMTHIKKFFFHQQRR